MVVATFLLLAVVLVSIMAATNARRALGPVFDIASVSEWRTNMSAHRTIKAPSSRDADLRSRRGELPRTVASRVHGVSLSRGVPVARDRSRVHHDGSAACGPASQGGTSIADATNAHRALDPVFGIAFVSEWRTHMSANRTIRAPSSRDAVLRSRRGELPLTVASRVRGGSLS